MRIAILGATSQIAKDLIISMANDSEHQLLLFARRPEEVTRWLASVGLSGRYFVANFTAFNQHEYDAIINFVGVGNPALTAAMGNAIFDITLRFDDMVLTYLQDHPTCRYLFLSSGAAYGSRFDVPATRETPSIIPLNQLSPQDWYGVAKLHAECRHRAYAELAIIDLRIFNYFSGTQDIEARFLITDILRAIRDNRVLQTSPDYIMRDFLHPSDFYQLIEVLLAAAPANVAVDCYSQAPIDKLSLLVAMQNQFGLKYETTITTVGVNATGAKPYYYSENKHAADFGYRPSLTSLAGVLQASTQLLKVYSQ